jgi:integrase
MPTGQSGLVFPATRGGLLDLNNFRRRDWAPAFEAAGIEHRRIYDLRHTFAAWALDAGVTTFELARYMGTGIRMIERTYGHLVADSDDRVRAKLEARAERVNGGRLDVVWTPDDALRNACG